MFGQRRRILSPEEKQANADARARKARLSKTCQICNRAIFAELGMIAHHGYKRPGEGWQTPSCPGARCLPYETDREVLGAYIVTLENWRASLDVSRQKIVDEVNPIRREESDWYFKNRKDRTRTREKAEFTRETYEAVKAAHPRIFNVYAGDSSKTFDDYKKQDLAHMDGTIRMCQHSLDDCRKRYAAWKKTHAWEGDQWVKVG